MEGKGEVPTRLRGERMNIKNLIETKIENIFTDLAQELNLKTGDITPMQSIEIENFKRIVEEWVEQNEEKE